MKHTSQGWGFLCLFFLTACLLFSLTLGQDAFAEAKKISGTGKITNPVSESNLFPGDDPAHMLTLRAAQAEDTTDDPDFGNVRVHFAETVDKKGNSATVKGYRVHTHPNGDKSFSHFEGTSIYTAADGSEGTFEGKWWITGGTGKYKGITGQGTYKGQVKLPAITYEWSGEYEIK